jgi:hypothetical protein
MLTFIALTLEPFETVFDDHWLGAAADKAFCCLRPEKALTGRATVVLLAPDALAEVVAKHAAEFTVWMAMEEAILPGLKQAPWKSVSGNMELFGMVLRECQMESIQIGVSNFSGPDCSTICESSNIRHCKRGYFVVDNV